MSFKLKSNSLRGSRSRFNRLAGKYFEPILEYLRTGEVNIPSNMSHEIIQREADFYSIRLPAQKSTELFYDEVRNNCSYIYIYIYLTQYSFRELNSRIALRNLKICFYRSCC